MEQVKAGVKFLEDGTLYDSWYLQRAKEWVIHSGLFTDNKSVAIWAVAEFLANQDGYTHYTDGS